MFSVLSPSLPISLSHSFTSRIFAYFWDLEQIFKGLYWTEQASRDFSGLFALTLMKFWEHKYLPSLSLGFPFVQRSYLPNLTSSSISQNPSCSINIFLLNFLPNHSRIIQIFEYSRWLTSRASSTASPSLLDSLRKQKYCCTVSFQPFGPWLLRATISPSTHLSIDRLPRWRP